VQAALAKDIPMHRVGLPDDIKALALPRGAGVGYVTHGDRDRRRLGIGIAD
jgi:hypothetical protein